MTGSAETHVCRSEAVFIASLAALLCACLARADPDAAPLLTGGGAVPPLNGETISGRFAGKLLAQAVRSGIPVIVIDDSAEHVVESAGPDDGMRHTRVSTDQLVRLLYLARYGVGGAPVIDETLPVVETTVEWSQDAATYGVARIAVGFWHRRLWIVHERAEDSDADFIALLIRYTW